jgi:hypothetical protein
VSIRGRPNVLRRFEKQNNRTSRIRRSDKISRGSRAIPDGHIAAAGGWIASRHRDARLRALSDLSRLGVARIRSERQQSPHANKPVRNLPVDERLRRPELKSSGDPDVRQPSGLVVFQNNRNCLRSCSIAGPPPSPSLSEGSTSVPDCSGIPLMEPPDAFREMGHSSRQI